MPRAMRRSRRSRTAWPMPVAIRVNGVGTEWHSLDLDAVARSKADLVVVPRAISAHLVHEVAEAVSKPVLAMIETAAGVLAAAEIAQRSGRADCRHQRPSLRPPASARCQPRADFSGAADDRARCARGRHRCVRRRVQSPRRSGRFLAGGRGGPRLGFDGKSLIHPDQIAPCHRAFAPSEAEIDRARRLVEASAAAPSGSRTR